MRVEFTQQAESELEELIDNLAYFHNEDIAERVELAVNNRVNTLSVFPYQCEAFWTEKFGSVRRMVVLSRTIVLYKIGEDVISIVSVCDSRTDWQ